MRINFPKQRYAAMNVALATQIIASGVCIGLLSSLSLPAAAQITPASLQLSQAAEPLAQQMLGQWQAKDPTSDQVLTFIFASEDTLYIILPPRENQAQAVEMRYKIDPSMTPMHLDVRVSEEETVQTLFELTPEGKLRMQLVGTNPGLPRPAALGEDATVFDKVSASTEVPDDAIVVEFTSQIKMAQQSEAVMTLGSMTRAQQAYYLEMSKFATNIDDLGIGIPSEGDNYRYEIVTPGDRSVAMTAVAKSEGLKSYTGAVFVIKDENGEDITIAGLCETDQSTMTPPAAPTAPANLSEEIQCPAGSHFTY